MHEWSTFGLPSVTSYWSPCCFCEATKEDMYHNFDLCSLTDLPWAEQHGERYQEECDRVRKVITLHTNADRTHLLKMGAPVYLKGKKGRGRTLACDVPRFGLKAGDRLEPGAPVGAPHGWLMNVADLETEPTPLSLTFIRNSKDARGRLMDKLWHINPIFDTELGTSPQRTVALDTLHGYYFGPMTRYASAVLWRIIIANPWHINGDQDNRDEQGCRRIRADLLKWQEDQDIPHNRRICDLTVPMLGARKDAGPDPPDLHPGDTMKTKAAETHMMLRFAHHELSRYKLRYHMHDLDVAGRALMNFRDTLANMPGAWTLPTHIIQTLMDFTIIALCAMQRAEISDTPKAIFFVHLAQRTDWAGRRKEEQG